MRQAPLVLCKVIFVSVVTVLNHKHSATTTYEAYYLLTHFKREINYSYDHLGNIQDPVP